MSDSDAPSEEAATTVARKRVALTQPKVRAQNVPTFLLEGEYTLVRGDAKDPAAVRRRDKIDKAAHTDHEIFAHPEFDYMADFAVYKHRKTDTVLWVTSLRCRACHSAAATSYFTYPATTMLRCVPLATRVSNWHATGDHTADIAFRMPASTVIHEYMTREPTNPTRLRGLMPAPTATSSLAAPDAPARRVVVIPPDDQVPPAPVTAAAKPAPPLPPPPTTKPTPFASPAPAVLKHVPTTPPPKPAPPPATPKPALATAMAQIEADANAFERRMLATILEDMGGKYSVASAAVAFGLCGRIGGDDIHDRAVHELGPRLLGQTVFTDRHDSKNAVTAAMYTKADTELNKSLRFAWPFACAARASEYAVRIAALVAASDIARLTAELDEQQRLAAECRAQLDAERAASAQMRAEFDSLMQHMRRFVDQPRPALAVKAPALTVPRNSATILTTILDAHGQKRPHDGDDDPIKPPK